MRRQRHRDLQREGDFPAEALEPFGIEAQHPDLFIDNLFDLDPAAVIAVLNGNAAS